MMTGRDLVLYILANQLEDEPIFKDGRFTCFLTNEEFAAVFGVGVATINAKILKGDLRAVQVGNKIYILTSIADVANKGGNNEKVK